VPAALVKSATDALDSGPADDKESEEE